MTPKTLNDPVELARIKAIYEEPVYVDDLTDQERWERKDVRDSNKINQAR